ncbi:MAG: FimB/Mfa2 family fimbrial subunit [Clostridium perfringens]|nr:FimB/Mfa2 family fimbrial subunit [Clostridium perfringens]
MKKLRSDLKKEDIALTKGHMKWYRVVEDEIRLFINEKAVNNKSFNNKIYWKENRGELSVEDLESSKKFYDKNKHLNIKVFIKNDSGTLYSEYKVKNWGLSDTGIEVIFS